MRLTHLISKSMLASYALVPAGIPGTSPPPTKRLTDATNLKFKINEIQESPPLLSINFGKSNIPRNRDSNLDEGGENVALKLVDGGLVHHLDIEDWVDNILFVGLHVFLDDIVEADPKGTEIRVAEPSRRLNEQVGVEAVDVSAHRVTGLGDAKHAHNWDWTTTGTGHPIQVTA